MGSVVPTNKTVTNIANDNSNLRNEQVITMSTDSTSRTISVKKYYDQGSVVNRHRDNHPPGVFSSQTPASLLRSKPRLIKTPLLPGRNYILIIHG